VGLAEFPGFDDAMRLRLAAAVDRLAEEYDGIYERPAITALVEESAESLSTRGITPFGTFSPSGSPGSASAPRRRPSAAWTRRRPRCCSSA